ncbi:hypothetical protein ABKN59_003283 [Abortiporus biennis]
MVYILPTIEQIENFLESVEEAVWNATPDVPNNLKEAAHRLYEDVSRLFPEAMTSLPDIKLPDLGAFEVPPPPPPPPPPKSLVEKSMNWVSDHKWTVAAVGVGLIGTSILVGYNISGSYRHDHVRTKKVKTTATTERRQIVVILGGDSPLGLPLILDLEKKGYIVITSVSNPDYVEQLEAQCHGYVRALVLDPSEPETIPFFLRSLSSTLSRRFPITTAGDPHASPSTLPVIYSVISLLTLPSQSDTPAPGPLEHLSLKDDYLSYLQTTHITPLQIIQALLPLIRNSSTRARDSASNSLGRRSIIVCLPSTDTRVGLPFASAQAMSAAATLRGVEVLRREIRIAALSAESDAMKNIKVVVVDVGSIKQPGHDSLEISHAMENWTPSEKVAYGEAFSSLLHGGTVRLGHGARKPTDTSAFVKTVVDVVRDGRRSPGGVYEIGLGFARFREWLRGDRVVVGAGAQTYALASSLPSLLLDALINLPHFLISIRNALLPLPPPVVSPYPPPVPPTAEASEASDPESEQHVSDEGDASSDVGSEADVESNSGVGESWISLKPGAVRTNKQEL